MLDLKEQLSVYLDHVVEGLDVEEAVERQAAAGSGPPGLIRPQRGLWPAWVYAVVAAAVVLLVVGVFAWIVASGTEDSIDTPPSTVVEPPETPEVPEGDFAPSISGLGLEDGNGNLDSQSFEPRRRDDEGVRL